MDIYTMTPDGRNVRKLTDMPTDDKFPSWSSDGRYIAFYSDNESNRDVSGEIYVVSVDGSDLFLLTDEPVYAHYPAWQPLVVRYVRHLPN